MLGHHTQRITKAAVMHDAKAILKQVVVLKQRCSCAVAHGDGGACRHFGRRGLSRLHRLRS